MKILLISVFLCISFSTPAFAAIIIHYYRAVDEIHAVSYKDFEYPDLKLHVELYRAKLEFKKPYNSRSKEDNFNMLILRLAKNTKPYKFQKIYSIGPAGEKYEIPIDAVFFNPDGSAFASRAEIVFQLRPDHDQDTFWIKNALQANKLHLQIIFAEQPPLEIVLPPGVIEEWNTLFSPQYNEMQMQQYIESKYG